MCRIVGFWDLNYRKDYDIQEIIIKMRDTMVNGGPDDEGVYIEQGIECSAFFKPSIYFKNLQ